MLSIVGPTSFTGGIIPKANLASSTKVGARKVFMTAKKLSTKSPRERERDKDKKRERALYRSTNRFFRH